MWSPSNESKAINPAILPWVLILALLASTVAVLVLPGKLALLSVAAVMAMLLAMPLLAWPSAATLAVIFILYSNAAVVAVRFHGVPMVLGAAVPLLLGTPLLFYLLIRQERIVVDSVFPLVMVYALVELISCLFSENPDKSLSILLTTMIEGVGLYFLIINVVRNWDTLRRVTWVLLAVGAMLGGLSLIQYATGSYNNNYAGFAQMSNAEFGTGQTSSHGEVHQRRLAGPLGDQNRYAQIMLMLVPLGLFRYFNERDLRLRFIAACATGLTLIGMTLTFSRGAAVGFVIVVAVMVAFRYIKASQALMVAAAGMMLLLALPQYSTRLMSLVHLGSSLSDIESGIASSDGAIRSRFTETMAAALILNDYPLTGVGPGMYPEYYHEYAAKAGGNVKEETRKPHILYLGIASELGLPGLLVFMAILACSLRNLMRVRRRCLALLPDVASMSMGYMLAIVAYMATGIFLHFAYVRYFWLMLALAGASCVIARAEIKRTVAQSKEFETNGATPEPNLA